MPVLRTERTYPLALSADSLNTGIVAAFDWAAEDGSTAADNGKDHSGNNRHWTVPTPVPLIVQTSVGKGRDTSQTRTVVLKIYEMASASALNLAVGTGDFSIYKRFRAPTVAAVSVDTREFWRLTDGGGQKIVLSLLESNSVGGYRMQITMGATARLLWNSAGNPTISPGAVVDLHLVRAAGSLKVFINGVKIITVADAADILSTAGGSKTINGNYGSGDTKTDIASIDDIYWNRALTDTEVTAHASNPYAYYAYVATPDSITISAPGAGATVSAAGFTVSGTYAGGTTVTLIEASFNGGAYVTLSASPAGGTFSAAMTGQVAGTGTLTVRSKNGSTVVATNTVTGLNVVADSVAFTVPPSTSDGAVPYRMFQADAVDQASVRITGTYSGAPTGIQYRWKGGAWATLVPSPTGGAFDQIVTLQGPGQGALEVRFTNNIGITASLAQIGVGDIYITAGQSNHVGMSVTGYVQPTAPTGNPTWQSVKLAKDGIWKPHLEQVDQPYDDRTNATYPIQGSTAPCGSYFGSLATRLMATGRPVAFVPCALGSTYISSWAVSTSTSQLYGAMLARATQIGAHKAVLWWQGEAEAGDASSTQAYYESALNTLINDWFARTGRKWYVMAINSASTGANFPLINAAILAVGASNPNCAGYTNLNGSFTGDIHYDSVPEIEEISARVFNAMTVGTIPAGISWTEGSESFSAGGTAAAPPISADASWTEGSEEFAAIGAVSASAFSVTAAWTEGAETFVVDGSVAGPAVTTAASWAEGSEVFQMAGAVAGATLNAAASWVEGAELFAASGAVGVAVNAVSCGWTESAEVCAIEILNPQNFTRAPTGPGYAPSRAGRSVRPRDIQGIYR